MIAAIMASMMDDLAKLYEYVQGGTDKEDAERDSALRVSRAVYRYWFASLTSGRSR